MNKKYLKPLLISLLVSIVLELCFFNFNALLSHTYSKDVDYKVYYDEQFQEQADGSHVLNEKEEYATIEIYDIQGNIKNIYINFDVTNKDINNAAFIEYYVKDEGYSDYYYNAINYQLPLSNAAYGSHFHNIDGSGNVTGILLKIYNDNGCTVKISYISLNETKPIQFSILRISIVFIVLSLILLLFKYRIGLNTPLFSLTNKQQRIVTISLIIFSILLSLLLGNINKDTAGSKPDPFYSSHYTNLTDSLLQGKVNIEGIDNKLDTLNNPYDLYERLNNVDEKTLFSYWDYAYYNNKFYVYFGVGPALMYFAPYKLITGSDFASHKANIVSFIIFSISFLFLLKKLLSKYYKDISLTLFIVLFIFSISTSGALILLTISSFYTVPITFSLGFGVLGLTLWLYSIKNNTINKPFMILGSLAMAVVLSGRPQLILLALLGIIIYWDFIKDIKHNTLNCLLALLPFVIICIAIGYYNYIRFNSPFDFGATYNITTNDMTKRGLSLNRVGLGLFTYLFEPIKIDTVFPFIQAVDVSSSYTGMITHEYTYGGLFAVNPLTLLPFVVPFIKNKNDKLYKSILILLASGLIVILFDTQNAGLLDRYFSDFSIFFVLATILSIIIILNNKETNNMIVIMLIIGFMLFSIGFNYLRLFGTADYQSLQLCSPDLYYRLQYLFQFWL